MVNVNNFETTVYFTNQRAKLTGYFLEIFKYENSIMLGNRKIKRKDDEKEVKKLTPEEIRIKNRRRAISRVIDIFYSNVRQWKQRSGTAYLPIFITLTFAENITDLDFAHNEFKKFIKRLSYENWGLNVNLLKYLAVVEFQRRGSIHYHVVFFNLPWIDRIYDKMRSIWGHGFTWIESVKTDSGIVGYLIKYLTKNFEGGKLADRKSYFTSRDLKKPIIFTTEETVNLIKAIIPAELNGRFHDYEAEFLGHTEIIEYNLKDYPEILENIYTEIIDKYIS